MIQRRNPQHDMLHQPGILRNGIQYLHEPVGGFGVWNGQFEQPGFDSDLRAEGWEVYPDNATSVMERVTGGLAGNWCFRGGNTAANQRGGYIYQLCYMPVDESRLYNIYCAAVGSLAAATIYFGCSCYTAAKAFIANANVLAGVAPGVAWVRYALSIGPAGTVPWPATTRYARAYVWLQFNNALAANTYMYVDDVGIWPVTL